SRLGRTIYIDALRGEVTPCLRVPFAPAGAPKLGEAPLEAVLAQPFFAAYRARSEERCNSCGVDLERALRDVAEDLAGAGGSPPALSAYRARSSGRRSLPQAPVDQSAHEDLPELPARE